MSIWGRIILNCATFTDKVAFVSWADITSSPAFLRLEPGSPDYNKALARIGMLLREFNIRTMD